MRQILFLVIVAVTLAGCKTTKLIKDQAKVTITETTQDTTQKVSITAPGNTVDLKENIASGIHFVYLKGKSEPVPCLEVKTQDRRVYSEDKTMFLNLKIDSLGNLAARSEQSSRELTGEVTVKNKVIHELRESIKTYEKQDSWFARTAKKFADYIVGVLILVIIVLAILNRFRPRVVV